MDPLKPQIFVFARGLFPLPCSWLLISYIVLIILYVSLFQEFADLNSMCWLETSAKDCTNVEEAFETMASKLCESHEQYLSFESERSDPGSFTLHGAYGVPEENKSQGYCCNST